MYVALSPCLRVIQSIFLPPNYGFDNEWMQTLASLANRGSGVGVRGTRTLTPTPNPKTPHFRGTKKF